MKAIILVIACLSLVGCARFSTTQIDRSYEDGKLVREISTRAAAHTVIEGKSALAHWKASQTDKTQGATVGGLSQEANSTNSVNALSEVRQILQLLRGP